MTRPGRNILGRSPRRRGAPEPSLAEPAGETPRLRVRNLGVTYGDFVAVEEASFDVPEGACVAMVGPNGNGKSSIATALAGLIYRSKGDVFVDGEPSPNGDPVWMVGHGVTLVPERRQLFPELSVLDNVLLGSFSWAKSIRHARDDGTLQGAFDTFPELGSRLKQPVGTLSGGQQQMVALARGLAARPKLIIIDEPCLGLAEVVARRVYKALGDMKAQGLTVLLIEENPRRALEISDSVIRIQGGFATPLTTNGEPKHGCDSPRTQSGAT